MKINKKFTGFQKKNQKIIYYFAVNMGLYDKASTSIHKGLHSSKLEKLGILS